MVHIGATLNDVNHTARIRNRESAPTEETRRHALTIERYAGADINHRIAASAAIEIQRNSARDERGVETVAARGLVIQVIDRKTRIDNVVEYAGGGAWRRIIIEDDSVPGRRRRPERPITRRGPIRRARCVVPHVLRLNGHHLSTGRKHDQRGEGFAQTITRNSEFCDRNS